MIGVHSPHRARDPHPERVAALAERFELTHPIYVDHDRRFFDALGATYWPTFALVDRQGRVRLLELGEKQAGTADAERFEALLRELLAGS